MLARFILLVLVCAQLGHCLKCYKFGNKDTVCDSESRSFPETMCSIETMGDKSLEQRCAQASGKFNCKDFVNQCFLDYMGNKKCCCDSDNCNTEKYMNGTEISAAPKATDKGDSEPSPKTEEEEEESAKSANKGEEESTTSAGKEAAGGGQRLSAELGAGLVMQMVAVMYVMYIW